LLIDERVRARIYARDVVGNPIEGMPDAVALQIGLLALGPQRWIHRRVEQVVYLDQATSRRRISFDFSVPRASARPGHPIYVPLAQFAKQPLTNFDLIGTESMPMLTTEENAAISTAVLMALARLRRPEEIDSIVERYVPRLVRSTNARDTQEALARIFPRRLEVGRTLMANVPFRTLAFELSRNFILYVGLRPDQAGERCIVKLAYDAAEPPPSPKTMRERGGWKAVEDQFPVANAGSAASYHVELVAPEDLHFTRGRFVGRREGRVVSHRIERSARRVHFHLSDLDRSLGLVFVTLRARSSMLTGAALFAVLSTLALLFVRLRLHEFIKGQNFDAVVAALLTVPGLLAAYLTRPGEHSTLSAFLAGVRLMATAVAVIALAAAFTLFAGYSERALQTIYDVLIALSALFAIGLVGSARAQHSRP
jgi:hypothetical protein